MITKLAYLRLALLYCWFYYCDIYTFLQSVSDTHGDTYRCAHFQGPQYHLQFYTTMYWRVVGLFPCSETHEGLGASLRFLCIQGQQCLSDDISVASSRKIGNHKNYESCLNYESSLNVHKQHSTESYLNFHKIGVFDFLVREEFTGGSIIAQLNGKSWKKHRKSTKS